MRLIAAQPRKTGGATHAFDSAFGGGAGKSEMAGGGRTPRTALRSRGCCAGASLLAMIARFHPHMP